MKFDMVLEESKLNILLGFLVRLNETLVLLAVLNQSKNKQIQKPFRLSCIRTLAIDFGSDLV